MSLARSGSPAGSLAGSRRPGNGSRSAPPATSPGWSPPPSRGRSRPPRIHPATRTFQALRIAVNEELKSLRIALERIPTRLAADGRLAVIAFHSLEDRLVKEAFRNAQVWEPLTRGPVEAGDDEVLRNSRSRSAKLRVARVIRAT